MRKNIHKVTSTGYVPPLSINYDCDNGNDDMILTQSSKILISTYVLLHFLPVCPTLWNHTELRTGCVAALESVPGEKHS